jgi:CBS domain-containing protein
MSLEKYLTNKNRVASILSVATMAEAARIMRDRNVGALVVTDPDTEAPLSVVTDRDLVLMLADGCDPNTTTVDQHVRTTLRAVSVCDDVSDVVDMMKEYGVRRVPVVDNGGVLAGIVCLDDVLMSLGTQLGDLAAAVATEIENEKGYETARVVAGALSGR